MQRKLKKHFIAYRLLRPIVYLVAKIVLNYKCKTAPDIKEPCLILSNHTMDWDPLLVACSFKNPINFLASEHAMRLGFLSNIIKTFFAPIQRVKGSTDANAALSLVSMVRKGVSVCLFPEGTRSFDGRTDKLHPTTGRLIKLCNSTVVTYRLEGGYLSSPRWGHGLRRGRIRGEVVNVYSADEIKNMSAGELVERVNADIYENAFERQKRQPCKYIGKAPAVGIERVLYVCPKCHKIGTIKSKGDMLFCSCGLEATYNKYGFLEGNDLHYSTIDKWNEWQTQYMAELVDSDSVFVKDDHQELFTLDKDHSLTLIDTGCLSTDGKELVFEERHFPFDKIKMSTIRKQDIVFNFEGVNYEIHSNTPRSALKYLFIYERAMINADKHTKMEKK